MTANKGNPFKDGLVVVTPPGKFSFFNPGTKQMQQYRSRSQNRGSGSGGGQTAYAAAGFKDEIAVLSKDEPG